MNVESVHESVKYDVVKLETKSRARSPRGLLLIAVAGILILALAAPVTHAQNLNWEGQTGAFVTPFAYTSASPANGIGLPAVSFHYLDGGDVLGGFYEVSGTVGFLSRFEVGYSRALSSAGTTPELSPCLQGASTSSTAKPTSCVKTPGSRTISPPSLPASSRELRCGESEA